MNERTTHPVAPRTSALARVAFAIVALIAAIVHVRAAQMRTAGLLDHDEAISLLAAAGKSQRAARLYDDQSAEPPVERTAGSIRDLLGLTGDTGFADVTASLRTYDIHPPLYFWSLHAIQRAGITNEACLRLFGSILLLAAAMIFDRLIWPDSNRLLRVLAFAVLLLSPTLIATAVELRHYAMLLPGFALSWAAVMQLSNPARRQGTTVGLIALAPMLLTRRRSRRPSAGCVQRLRASTRSSRA